MDTPQPETTDPAMRALEQQLADALGDAYSDVRFWKQGGTRYIFSALWAGAQRRVIKMDKRTLESPRARRHVLERGCDTDNELRTLLHILKHSADENLEMRHISPLLDFRTVAGHRVTVERCYNNHLSLEENVAATGPFEGLEADIFSRKMLAGADFLINFLHLYHRDLKPSNILVAPRSVIITDFANAALTSETHPGFLPTAGGHLVMDPLLMTDLMRSDAPVAYTDMSELYAIAATIHYALTGRYIAEFDPDARTATVWGTQDPLLRNDGSVDVDKYEHVLTKALNSLPGPVQKHQPWFSRSLTLDISKRYPKITDAKEALDDMLGPRSKTFWQSLKGNGKLAVLVGALGISIGGGGGFLSYANQAAETQRQVRDASMYSIVPQCDSRGMSVSNNLFSMQGVRVLDKKFSQLYPHQDFKDGRFGIIDGIHVTPGQQLVIDITARRNAGTELLRHDKLPLWLPEFPVRIYVEGFSGSTESFVRPEPCDYRELDDSEFDTNRYYHNSGNSFTLPALSTGNHTLAVDVYMPQRCVEFEGIVRQDNAGKLIASKRIPLVVGAPAAEAAVELFAPPEYAFKSAALQLSGVLDRNERDLVAHLRFIGEDTEITPGVAIQSASFFSMPERQHGTLQTLEIVTTCGEEVVGVRYIPLVFSYHRKSESTDRPPISDKDWKTMWRCDFAYPGKEWSEQLPAYRQKAMERYLKK